MIRLAVFVAVICAGLALGAKDAFFGSGHETTTAVVTSSPFETGYPTPPRGSVVVARPVGQNDLGLAFRRTGSGIHVQASVVNGSGQGVAGLRVAIGGSSATSCGAGCYSADLPTVPARLPVRVGATTVVFHVPNLRQAPDGGAVVERTNRAWAALRSLVVHDSLSSGTGVTLRTLYTMVAPDRLTYSIEGEGQAVIIGRRRWDRADHRTPWRLSATTPIHQPQHPWTAAVDAHVLARTSRSVRVSFFDPGTPGWFEIEVERATGRTLWLRMTAPAHFMVERYSGFDSGIRIEPPTSASSKS